MKFNSYGNTDLGKKRRRNEDAFLSDPQNGLFAVADGLGGLSAGDIASKIAISTLESHISEALQKKEQVDLRQVFARGHKEITRLGAEVDPVRGAGATLTVVMLRDNLIEVGHAGDSAAYLLSGETFRKLTTDHTEAEEFRKNRPGETPPAIFEHSLTRCLGQPGEMEADFDQKNVSAGDRLLLCTDGLTRGISPDEIAERMKECDDPKELVEILLRLANDRGGSDNATAIAISIE